MSLTLVQKPAHMNAIAVTFRLLGKGATTVKDKDYRETLGIRNYGQQITIIGQLMGARTFFKLQRTQTGDMNPSSGALVFRPEVLKEAGVTLNKGDRIIAMGGATVDFTLTKVSPLSPYHGGFLLVSCEFTQTQKVQESV
jgi:hypothetical protein